MSTALLPGLFRYITWILKYFSLCLLLLLTIKPSFSMEAGYVESTYTLIRGQIFAYYQGKKIHANLKVFESVTGQEQSYVYSPDTLDGSFYMFLSPNKNYEVFLEAADFEPYRTELFLPMDIYYYEWNQEIEFEKIELLGHSVGQKAKSLHYKTEVVKYNDRSPEDMQKLGIDYMLSFVNHIIQSSDKERLEDLSEIQRVLEVQSYTEPTEAEVKDTSFDQLDQQIERLVSGEGSIEELETSMSANDRGKQTIYYKTILQDTDIPDSVTNKEAIQLDPLVNERALRQVVVKHYVFFPKNKKKLLRTEREKLREIAIFLKGDEYLYVEMFGRMSPLDSPEMEKQAVISSKRVRTVFKYLKKEIQDLKRFRMIAYGLEKELLPKDLSTNSDTQKSVQLELLICRKK